MHLGIIGPAQSGKSTLFAAATGQPARLGHGAHRALILVPDDRLGALAKIENPRKIVPAEVDYLDWGGVAADPTTAAEMESKIPAEIRDCDALVVVVRAFESDVVAHPRGTVDAAHDLEDSNLALVLADLATVENRLSRVERTLKVKKDTELEAERTALERWKTQLESEQPIRDLDLSDQEWKRLRGFGLLTAKPLLVVVNLGEDQIGDAERIEAEWQAKLGPGRSSIIALCAQIEMEIGQLGDDERGAFLTDMGIAEPALGRMIRASYGLLGLLSFFTAAEPEVRAWTITEGQTAVEAARVIHSDIARGFIRAEVIPYDDYVEHRGVPGAKQAGKFRLEGKDYIVRDGDVIYFRFNV
jgi:hypothetical protein